MRSHGRLSPAGNPILTTILFVALVASLMWPMLQTGLPAYSADSAAYLHGGRKVAAFLGFDLAAPPPRISAPRSEAAPPPVPEPAASPVPAPAPPPAPKARAEDGTQGVRSIVYSAFTFLLSWPGTTLLALIFASALIVAGMILLCLRVAAPGASPAHVGPLLLLLAGGTALAPFVNLATPDIFAGLTILGIAMLAVYGERLGLLGRLFVVGVTAFAIAVHASHLLIAIGMGALLGLMALWNRREAAAHVPFWVTATILLGIAAVVLSGVVGFREFSLAPKRYPFALARSMEDGPARWYLEKNCAREHYTICDVYPDGFPDRAGNVLWGDTGLVNRASAAQMDRIRAEEMTIVRRAFLAYPGAQIGASLRNLAEQMLWVGYDPALFHNKRIVWPSDMEDVSPPAEMQWHVMVQIAIVIASLVAIALLFRGALPQARRMTVLILLGILGNDAICAIIAASDIRYQNRLLWLLPLAAYILLENRAASRSR